MQQLSHRWIQIQRQAVLRYARSLFDDVAGRELDTQTQSHLRLTPSLMFAYGLACVVWIANVILATVGIWVLWWGRSNAWLILLGLSLLLVAWVARPRRAKAPAQLLVREDFPTLHAVSDRIAQALHTRSLAGIGICAEFNANYRSVGWQSTRYMELGTTLLVVLDTDELLAIIAHELSHGANNDPMRSQMLYGAVETLARWGETIRPLSIGRSMPGVPYGPVAAILAIPLELTQLAASELLLLMARGSLLLVARQSQRAEYLADLIATRAAGAAAMARALEKLCMFEAVDAAINQHALTNPYAPLEAPLRDTLARLPLAQKQAALEAAHTEQTQVDASHPPTTRRIDMVQRHGSRSALVILSPDETVMLRSEVSRLIQLMQRAMVDRKLVQIYG
jgi:Zn-dependent protease with chaperone function